MFRVFTQHDSELTPAGFANKQKELGVSYGMVVVHTGSTQVDGDGLRNYELDFGVGHRYTTDVVADTGSGLGGYYPVAVMRELGFRKLEANADYVLSRPTPAPRAMWGRKQSCRFRLQPEWARLNCYCVILFKRYMFEDQEPSLEMALPSLLCKYSECWSTWQEAHAEEPLATRLLDALVWGRRLFPDSFVHVAIGSMDAQRGSDGVLDSEDAEYIGSTARGSTYPW